MFQGMLLYSLPKAQLARAVDYHTAVPSSSLRAGIVAYLMNRVPILHSSLVYGISFHQIASYPVPHIILFYFISNLLYFHFIILLFVVKKLRPVENCKCLNHVVSIG